jgi:guanylate kinase
METATEGKLVIISGPSGAGKSTVLERVLEQCALPLELSVSATTRLPRPGEADGVNYHFLAKEEFLARRDDNEFLEWKEVYGRGDFYGTLRETVTAGLNAGKWVVLEIDVEGAMMVLEAYPRAITIFLHPGSFDELERRLRDRQTETEETIQRRLEVARNEMQVGSKYKYQVVNDVIEHAVQEICDLLSRGE